MYLAKNQAVEAFKRDIDAIIMGYDSFLMCASDDKDLLDIKVVDYNQGYGLLAIRIPEAMIKGFVPFLEMFHSLWLATQFKIKFAKAEKNAVDPVELEKRDRRKAEYEKELFTVFDGLIKKGVPVREAVKKTRVVLKEKGHPWSDYHLVVSALSSSGRLKGTGFHGKTK